MLHELVVSIFLWILAGIELELCPAIVAVKRDVKKRIEFDGFLIEHKVLLLRQYSYKSKKRVRFSQRWVIVIL
jgi:hypothetical protein